MDSEKVKNYWIFIISQYEGILEEYGMTLWEYCIKNNVAAMQYQEGIQSKYTRNINLINKIDIGDGIIAYLNENRIGAVGLVKKKFYENLDENNGFGGEYGQRIDVDWINPTYEGIKIDNIKNLLDGFPKNLYLATIHESLENDYNVFENLLANKDIHQTQTINTDEGKILLDDLLLNKKQIILYGPPGTGKTYKARNFAVTFLNGMNNIDDINGKIERYRKKGNLEFITFHPSYSYEEFMEGITVHTQGEGEPSRNLEYKLKSGIFKTMCKRALTSAIGLNNEDFIDKTWKEVYEQYVKKTNVEDEIIDFDSAKKYILIIDEINRGDISKIFGELITLLEKDKRLGENNELTATLPYSNDTFSVPPNLFVIGTMNTADRSIALLDVALRRRFGFKEMTPDFNVVQEYLNANEEELNINEVYNLLLKSKEVLEKINERICEERSIGRDKQIGHSYLLQVKTVPELMMAWQNEILPLLEEYCYGDYDKINLMLFKNEEDSHWIQKKNGIQSFKSIDDLGKFIGKIYTSN